MQLPREGGAVAGAMGEPVPMAGLFGVWVLVGGIGVMGWRLKREAGGG
jgi:hypothetical protein